MAKNSNKAVSFISLGQLRYLSAIKYMDAVIGNSSSGLIEVPSFKVPTINIGDRQQGRVKATSVIDCEANEASIAAAIEKALSDEFKDKIKASENPYGTNNSSADIVKVLKTTNLENIVKKKFYNIPVK